MPIYEYVCRSCAHRFEVKQKLSDPPVDRCMRCGEAVSRVISAPAIMFKGTGWYVTDYSDKLKAPSDRASGNGQPSSDSAEATKDGSKKDQKAPVSTGEGTSSASGSKETAAPASSSSNAATPSSAAGSGTSSSPKPSGSST